MYFDNKLVTFTVVLAGSAGADVIKYAGNKPFCTSATHLGVDATHSAGAKRALVVRNQFLTASTSKRQNT